MPHLFVLCSLAAVTIGTSFAWASPQAPEPTAFEKACQELASKSYPTAAEKLKAVLDLQWNHTMETYPEAATGVGDERGQDKLTDMALESIQLRKREETCALKMIKSVDRSKLGPSDQLNYDLFEYVIRRQIEGNRFPGELMPISQLGGVHDSIPQILLGMRRSSAVDYRNRVARLKLAPKIIRQHRELLELGLKKGITPPKVTLKKLPEQFEVLLSKDMKKNPIYETFLEIPESVSSDERRRIQEEARAIIEAEVLPELGRFRDFLVKTYIPGARESLAFSALPDGAAWYAYAVEAHTTTKLTPQEIHEIGLKETARLDKEMSEAMRATGWKKDRAAFFRHLRTDPKFFFKTREDLLAKYRDITKRADPELPRLFGRLPSLPYGVKPVPEFAERSAPTAYYQGGSLEAGRPAWFFANTGDLKSRPKWDMEALALHETVPGHHLQIALAQEQSDLPQFRRRGFYTAYVEGWGLYAETLGAEMGFYKDPYSRVGKIAMEMWRANRLVVDTGIHALGWSRQKAIDYMKEHTPKPPRDIEIEVDRYIVMPGQALSYKIGQLKLTELRARAKQELGDKFDVRAFHDAILRDGALPLEILEKKIGEWIAEQSKK